MNILNLDCIHDLGTVDRSGICPEWVMMEQLYNCENFYQVFTNPKSLFRRLFERRRRIR